MGFILTHVSFCFGKKTIQVLQVTLLKDPSFVPFQKGWKRDLYLGNQMVILKKLDVVNIKANLEDHPS